MVSRHEVDMNEIKGYYKSLYGISLRQAIMVGFLSGDMKCKTTEWFWKFSKGLLTLVLLSHQFILSNSL